MGNHLSCISPAALDERLQNSATSATTSHSIAIKFLNCETGALSELEGPLTAAEAMLEFPAYFLSCLPSAVSICGGAAQSRITALSADKELQAFQLYLLLPMRRLNTRFSLQETAFFATLQAAQSSNGKRSITRALSTSKVAPFPCSTGDAICSAQASVCEEQSTVVMRAFPFKGLQGTDLNQGPASAPAMNNNMGLAKLHAGTVGRSKSWMPKLETVEENVVAL